MLKITAKFVLVTLISLLISLQEVQAQSCQGSTLLIGEAPLGTDEQEELFIASEGFFLSEIYHCIETGSFDLDTHFRGFVATFTSKDD